MKGGMHTERLRQTEETKTMSSLLMSNPAAMEKHQHG